MPVFQYKCECGIVFERLFWYSENAEDCVCQCGRTAPRIMSKPQILPGKVNPKDMNGYREMVEAGCLDKGIV